MNLFIIIATFLTLTPSYAEEISLSAPDYDAAESAPSYFRFVGHSRKLGIIGTSFTGYAKKANIRFKEKGGNLSGVTLTVNVADLDTDNDSRNEKMRDTCLAAKDFPEVVVRINDPILIAAADQVVTGEMKVRGETVPLSLRIKKEEEGVFSGASSFKLTAAKIPDPSIAIASVRDEFELEFRLSLRGSHVP